VKPALFYTIKRDFGMYEVMAVTSEKAGRRGRYYGRDRHGNATHCLPGETFGRFGSEEEAAAFVGAIKRIKADFASSIEQAERNLAKLRNECENAIKEAIENAMRAAADAVPA
jgi:hypothetical protein